MTPEMERIGKILVEAEGGCWHKFVFSSTVHTCSICKKCGISEYDYSQILGHSTKKTNPDFSEWQHFGRLLKIARAKSISIEIEEHPAYENTLAWLRIKDGKSISAKDFDQIPALVATELAKILEKK